MAEKSYFCAYHLEWIERMAAHNDLGKWGEEVAATYLRGLGFVIKETDWHYGNRDLDIVAISEDQSLLVVAEVKTRADDEAADPLTAIDKRKMHHLAVATNAYVKQHAVDAEVRFDVVTVVGTDEAHCHIDHLPDAFNPLLL